MSALSGIFCLFVCLFVCLFGFLIAILMHCKIQNVGEL